MGRPIQFDTWLVDLQLYLLSDSKDSVLLFDLASGAATAPPATADSATRSQWLTRDAAARLAIRNHLPLAECAHFGLHKTDLVSHLRTSGACCRATVPAEFLDRNQPPMFITLYFIITRLPDSLRSVRDHFRSLDPISLTVDLLEQNLLTSETSAVAVGAARGTPLPPFLEGYSPSPLAPSYASAAAADIPAAEDFGAACASGKHRSSKGKGGRGGGGGSRGGGGGSSGCSGGKKVVAAVGVVVGVGALVAAVEAAVGVAVVAAVELVAAGLELSVEVLEVARGSSSSVGVRHSRPSSFVNGCFSVGRLGVEVAARMSFARMTVLVRHAGGFTLSTSASPASTTLGVLSLVTRLSAPASQICLGASRCFFRDNTTLTLLSAPVPVWLADPSGGSVVARSSTVLLCPAVPFGSLSGLHLPSFSMNLVSTDALHDSMVTTTTHGGQRVSICTCTRTGSHLATSGSTPLLVSPPVAPDSPGAPPPWSPLPATPAWHALPPPCLWSSQVSASPPALANPPCLRCVKGRQRAAPHSSSFPRRLPPCRLSTWTSHLELCERLSADLPVLRLHSDRDGEFSSNLLQDFYHGEGILQTFTLPDSPQSTGIAERRIGLVMEPRVSLPETSPTLRSTRRVGDASVFWVWASLAFVRDTSADKLSTCAIPCVFLGFPSDALGWQFYHPTSRRVFPSQDITFDELVPFYRLFPYNSAPPPPPPLLLAPGPPPVDPLPPQGPTPSGVYPVDPLLQTVPVAVAGDSGAARGTASGGAESRGAEPGGAESEGAGCGGPEPGGSEHEGVEPGDAGSKCVESGGAEPWGAASSGGAVNALPRLSPRPEALSPQQLREWLVRHACLRSGAAGAGGTGNTGDRCGGATAGAGGGTRGTAATGPGGACTRGTGATGTGGVGVARARDPTEPGTARTRGTGAGGAGAGGAGARGTGAGDT
ncbi:unnamed protein product [Closterium sp. NIES-53]